MTCAGSLAGRTVGRSLSTAAGVLRRQVWLWPIVAVALLSGVGLVVRGAIEQTMKASLTSELETLRDVEVAMLRTWLASQERNAESLANDRSVRRLVAQLLDADTPSTTDAAELARTLAPAMNSQGYDGFFVLDKQKRIVAALDPQAVGRDDFVDDPGFEEFMLLRPVAGDDLFG